jgi:hypothetical protein
MARAAASVQSLPGLVSGAAGRAGEVNAEPRSLCDLPHTRLTTCRRIVAGRSEVRGRTALGGGQVQWMVSLVIRP